MFKRELLVRLREAVARCRRIQSCAPAGEQAEAAALAEGLAAIEDDLAAQIDDYMAGLYARHHHQAIVARRGGPVGSLSGIWRTDLGRRAAAADPARATRCVACAGCAGLIVLRQSVYGRIAIHQRCEQLWFHNQERKIQALHRKEGAA